MQRHPCIRTRHQQSNVGEIVLKLYKGKGPVIQRQSPFSLYSENLQRLVKMMLTTMLMQRASFAYLACLAELEPQMRRHRTMTKAVLWGGRFASGPDEAFKAFNDSLRFDYRLAEQDIIGSKAWAVSLKQIDVLTEQECQDLCAELDKLLASVQANPKQILASDAEDIHSWVESHLVDTLGGLGKKLHTGRSRNDQVATDLKLWVKKRIDEIKIALLELQSVLIKLAEVHPTAVIPGYTHLQRAQPVLFAHWCLAYVEMFNRDWQRMNDATKHMDTPLGSGALADWVCLTR